MSADFQLHKHFLSADRQVEIVRLLRTLRPGFYTPKTRWGRPMSVQMNCLGWHWSARDYRYHDRRTDADGLPPAPIPSLLQEIAGQAARETGYLTAAEVRPYDVCVVNWYGETGSKLGDHVDNSETPASIAAGDPVVSLSIGASCVFRMGGLARTDPYESMTLDSGDLVLFGRTKRLAYHGVKKILPGSTPGFLDLEAPGRFNLTFRIL